MFDAIARNRDHGIVAGAVGAPRTDRLLVTREDAARLRSTLERAPASRAPAPHATRLLLGTALEAAVVVPPERIPADVVTMRSRLVLKDVESGARREIALVYPEEERPHHGRISVLTPLGAALLGASEGTVLRWPLPSGRTAFLKVHELSYQPERAGDLHL